MRDFYVYTYTDPRNGDIIYVGKGCGERHLYHWKYGNPSNSHFDRKLAKIRKQKLEPEINIVFTSKDEDEVYELEEFLIKEIGRTIDGGTLCNIVLGGKGHPTLDLPDDFYEKLGKQTDKSIADEYGISNASAVTRIRVAMGVDTYKRFSKEMDLESNKYVWADEHLSLLGTLPDLEVANMIGISKSSVRRKRLELGILSSKNKTPYKLSDKYRSWDNARVFINDITGETLRVSVNELADILECDQRSVRNLIPEYSYRKTFKGWRCMEDE